MIDATVNTKTQVISFQLKVENGTVNLYYRNLQGRAVECIFDVTENRSDVFARVWHLTPEMTIAEGLERAQLTEFIVASIQFLKCCLEVR